MSRAAWPFHQPTDNKPRREPSCSCHTWICRWLFSLIVSIGRLLIYLYCETPEPLGAFPRFRAGQSIFLSFFGGGGRHIMLDRQLWCQLLPRRDRDFVWRNDGEGVWFGPQAYVLYCTVPRSLSFRSFWVCTSFCKGTQACLARSHSEERQTHLNFSYSVRLKPSSSIPNVSVFDIEVIFCPSSYTANGFVGAGGKKPGGGESIPT